MINFGNIPCLVEFMLNSPQDKMVRPNDPFWNYVEDMNDGSMKCKFCGHLFAKGTSISRIKWHFSGERGRGVGICGQVPKEVQEAVILAMHGGNKRHKSIPSSSNVNDLVVDAGRMQVGVQGMEQGWRERIHSHVDMQNTGEGSFQHVDRIVSPMLCRTVEGMEVGCLGKLETLECHFKGLSDFVEYLRSRDGIQSLSTYKILVGTLNEGVWIDVLDFPSKTVMLGDLSINGDRDFQVKFLNGIQGLVCQSIDAKSLCDVLSLENATELEIIRIENCDSMESLVSSSWFCSATLPLPSHNGMFSRLKEFYSFGCDSMKKLFPLELLSYLVNLEVISVSFCEKMEEIIGTTDEESSTSNPIAELTLPKLTKLYLLVLPELKGICSAKLICNYLKEIDIRDCEKLKRMAISLPLLENGQPSPHPSLERINVFPEEWWETVEWEPPNAKEVLRPIVNFWSTDDTE